MNWKHLTKAQKIDDFLKTYYNGFSKLYNVEEKQLLDIYLEDPYFGFPEGAEPGSAFDSEVKALYCMIRLAKPKSILEIGNYKGDSSNHILAAVEKNGTGEVTLLDIEERIDYDEIRNHNFNRMLIDSFYYLLQYELQFNFYAQDGCHKYKHVKRELQIIKDRTHCNFDIWSHDYFAPISKHVNIKKAWDEEGKDFQWYKMKDSISTCGIVMGRYKNANM